MLMNNPVLQEIYDTGEVLDGGGAKRPLGSHVSKVSGEAMYQVVREANPAVCVEIGRPGLRLVCVADPKRLAR